MAIDTNAQRDRSVNIEEIMHTAYLQYSLSVNVGRAIPDVRDGLKPGNRRILYAMKKLGLIHNHAYSKCAKVVGEVIGNYHPHGDQAIYDTLVRMAQDFAMRNPLIDGQGNFGSIDGDAAAAYRYTECRLQRLAEELLRDLEKETVDMITTFDGIGIEPTVLPAYFPNLLVNGSTGIGVGMATNIPPHNLGEVIDATVHLIDNPNTSVKELMQFIKGPDFPTGASIHGIQPIIDLYENGHGSIRLQGKSHIETLNKGRESIIITEIPYALKKEHLVVKIADLANSKVIPGISAITDESSSRSGIRIRIDIKHNEMASIVLNQLYKHSPLQTSFGCQLLVVNRNQPQMMNLIQVLQAYREHRLEVMTRRAQFELNKAEARAHILQGLLIAVDKINEIIKIIRQSKTRELANESLIKGFELSKQQSNAILEIRLHQLTGLAREELENEFNELEMRIQELKDLLSDADKRLAVLKNELLEIKDKYADIRRTEIHARENELSIEDLIQPSICAIPISNNGYIKRLPVDVFRTQRRGGKGIIAMQTKAEDFVQHLFSASTHDYILFFTDKGRMFRLKVYEIPSGQRTSRGKAIINLIPLEQDEAIRAILTTEKRDDDNLYLVFSTRRGIIKKTRLSAFKNLRRRGIRAINIGETDKLIDVQLSNGQQEIILFTSFGIACRFHEDQIRPMGRTASGVIGIRLGKKENDSVVAMSVVNKHDEILNITRAGIGKRSNIGMGFAEQDKKEGGGYRLTNRGGKGIISIRLKAGDQLVTALKIQDNDELMISTLNGQLIRISTNDIRSIGRISQGVKVIDLKSNDSVTSVSLTQEIKTVDDVDPL